MQLCYVACNDTAHQCIDLVSASGELVAPKSYSMRANGKLEALEGRPTPTVREDDCVGCRLCHNICPVEHCIEMVELPIARPRTTWQQLATERPEVTESWEAMLAYRKSVGIDIH